MFDRLAVWLPGLWLADGLTGGSPFVRRVVDVVTGGERMPVTFTPTAAVGVAAG